MKTKWRLPLPLLVHFLAMTLFACNQSSRPADDLQEKTSNPAAAVETQNFLPTLPVNLDFDIFTTEQGLCSNTITHLFQDSKGFLWVGTDGGLNCFDGYVFRSFRHDENDTLSLPDNYILEMDEDSRGDIWTLTPKGLWQLDPRSGNAAIWQDSLIFSQVNIVQNKLTIDGQDRAWMFCTDSLTYFDIPKKRFVRLPEPGGRVYETAGGELIAFVFDKPSGTGADTLLRHKVLRWSEGKQAPETLLDTTYSATYSAANRGWEFNAGAFDGDGDFWAGRQDGYLQKFDFQTRRWSFLFIPPRERPWHFGTLMDIEFSNNSRALWMTGFGGLYCFFPNPKMQPRFVRFHHEEGKPNGLPVLVALRTLEDRAGNVWAGTMGGGLCRFSPTRHRFQVFQQRACDTATLPDKKIEAVHFDRQGRLWAGTAKGLCRLDDPGGQIFKTFRRSAGQKKGSANDDWIRSIAEDTATGRLILAYWGDLPNLFDLKTEQFLPLEISNFDTATWQQFRNPYTSSVFAGAKGNFFFGDWGAWFFQYELPSKKYTWHGWETIEEARKMGVGSALLSIAYPDRSGTVWLGSDENKGGLVAFDLLKNRAPRHFSYVNRPIQSPDKNAIRSYLPEPNDSTRLPTAQIKTIFEDSKNRLWVGTASGFCCLKDRQAGVFQNYGLAEGLPDVFVQSIIEDDRGRLWLGTNNGLCCFDPEKGRAVASFDVNDGLPANQFSPNASAKGKSGELAFGTSAGLCLFHPDSLARNETVPSVEITGFEVNGAPVARTSEPLHLSHAEKNVEIHFASLDFSDPSQNRYQYFLEGYENTWSQPTDAHEVSYTNLSPGKYVFRVRGSNNDGVWNMDGAAQAFLIAQPWWQWWWLQLLAGGAIAWLIYQLIRRREQKMRKRQVENERLIRYLQVQTLQAQINPHFIFNVLGAMQNQILNANPQEANRHLVNLSKLIRRFLESSIGSAPPGKGLSQHEIPLEQEMELLKMYIEFEHLQRPGKFSYEIQVAELMNIANLTIPPMIVQPYVENAIKHGLLYLEESERAGKVVVSFAKKEDALLVTVDDNGVGRRRAAEIQQRSHQIYKSHGTRLVEERVAILNEMGYHITIETNDRNGGGTVVTIEIKD